MTENKKIQRLIVCLNLWRIIPAYYILLHCKFKEAVLEDISVWSKLYSPQEVRSPLLKFGYSLLTERTCVNIALNRLHKNPISFLIVRILFKPLNSLYLNMSPQNYGGGLSFQHGFSTIVAAKKIGKNCRINQQVTIGYNGDYAPVIGDDVLICAGAIVIGDVHIGDGAVVGAGSVVVKDVPPHTVVAGVPAAVLKKC